MTVFALHCQKAQHMSMRPNTLPSLRMTTTPQDAFVQRLRHALKSSGLTQRAVADRLDVKPQSISTWLRKGTIHRQHIAPLCKVCGVDIAWLLTGEGQARLDDEEPTAMEMADDLTKRLGLSDQVALASRLLLSIKKRVG